MSTLVNVHDFKTNYSKYLNRVAGGEEIMLGKYGRVIAKISPQPAAQPRKPGALKGKIWMSDDFDEPMMWLWDTVRNKD